MKRTVAVMVLVTVIMGSPTFAQQIPYPPSTPTAPPVTPGRPNLGGNQASFPPGAPGTFTLTGCNAGGAVSFQVFSAAGAPIGSPISAVAGADGSASVQIPLPTTPGSYYVVGTCVASGAPASFDFVVAALPKTGSNPNTPMQIGVILMATGALLFVVAGVRRRQRASTPA